MEPVLQPARIDWAGYGQTAAGIVSALQAMGKAVDASGLEKSLTELIKIRVSQINGCAFCLQLHLNHGRGLGVEQARLDMIAAWRDASIYTARERSALAWAEALTLMAQHHAGDGLYAQLQSQFSESEIAFLTAAIANINAWNRIAAGLRFTPASSSKRLPEAS